MTTKLLRLFIRALGQIFLFRYFFNKSYASVKSSRINKQANKKIDIVVPVHNAPQEVRLCFNSIKQHHHPNQRLIIVDDGSDKSTEAYLKEFAKTNSWCKLVRNNKAGGFTKAANRGIKASSGELVIILNSDTVVTDGWAEKLADALESTGSGIVGPLSNAASVQSIPDFRSRGGQTAVNDLPAGVTAEDINKHCEKWTKTDILPQVPLVHGFCFGISRQVIEKVGLFNEIVFPKGYGEENDYCFRAANGSFKLVVATHTYIFHAKSKSYSSELRTQLMDEGSKKLRELYGNQRVDNAIKSMVENPLLIRMRNKAKSLY